mmetsp:Transcript_9164/g.30531  ORF Transcript_9164/g.30531 Transcript_9164/m.30531 type:complete len:236 (+) Transcript_9164:790-1497(+)
MCKEKSRETAAAFARNSSASRGSGERIWSTRRTIFFPFAPSPPRNDFHADKIGASTNSTAFRTSPQPEVTENPSGTAAFVACFSTETRKFFTKDNAAASCAASARATCAPARDASAEWLVMARKASSPRSVIHCTEKTDRSSGNDGGVARHSRGSICTVRHACEDESRRLRSAAPCLLAAGSHRVLSINRLFRISNASISWSSAAETKMESCVLATLHDWESARAAAAFPCSALP